MYKFACLNIGRGCNDNLTVKFIFRYPAITKGLFRN